LTETIPRVLIMTSALDEGIKLERTIEGVREFVRGPGSRGATFEILVVDDGSSDGWPQSLVACLGFALIRNPVNRGAGYSVRVAIDYAQERGHDILVTIAGNNKDDAREIPRLIEPSARGEADLVQGSRYLSGGGFGNMPLYRQLATRFVHPILFSLVARQWMTDSTNGFRAVSVRILRDERFRLHQSWLDRYELEPYLLFRAIRLGYRVREVPVTKVYPARALGYTKMRPVTGWWSILRPLVIVGLGIRR